MPGAARLGDTCTGHDGWPPRPNDSASSDVFINGKGAHRQGDHWVTHCRRRRCHDSTCACGSSTVFVNGKPLARIGDAIACGSTIASGSSDVIAG